MIVLHVTKLIKDLSTASHLVLVIVQINFMMTDQINNVKIVSILAKLVQSKKKIQ